MSIRPKIWAKRYIDRYDADHVELVADKLAERYTIEEIAEDYNVTAEVVAQYVSECVDFSKVVKALQNAGRDSTVADAWADLITKHTHG